MRNHLSVGALVVRQDGKAAVNYFKEIEGYPDITLLMRETLEPGETLEGAVKRGLMEEFGMKAEILTYLGEINCQLFLKRNRYEINKTTLYFLCQYQSHNESDRAKEDKLFGGLLEWRDPVDIIDQMRMQASRVNRLDVDESPIVLRYLKFVQKQTPFLLNPT